jgi:hypothetical protein
MYAIILLFLIIILFYFFLRKTTEYFQVAPDMDIKPEVVSRDAAMKIIRQNFDKEYKIIKQLLLYYNKIVTAAAAAKTDKKEDIPKFEPEVRATIEKEQTGKVINLYELQRILNIINSFDIDDSIKFSLYYMFLPKEVKIYYSTADYLNKKAVEIYKYLATMGGPKSEKNNPKGSTPESLGITRELFTDAKGCCPNAASAATINVPGKGNLKDLIDNTRKNPPSESDIQRLYNISNTREWKLKDSLKAGNFDNTMKEIDDNFKKLEALQNQLQNPSDEQVAGYISDGKPLTPSINGFMNYEGRDPKYAFLEIKY